MNFEELDEIAVADLFHGLNFLEAPFQGDIQFPSAIDPKASQKLQDPPPPNLNLAQNPEPCVSEVLTTPIWRNSEALEIFESLDNKVPSFEPHQENAHLLASSSPDSDASSPSSNRNLSRMKFSPEEDKILTSLVKQYGKKSWCIISQMIGDRTPRQCRERWKNYLCPGLNKTPWTDEEDQLLFQLYQQFGAQWVKISKQFSGRTDINVKNRWVTKFKRNTSGGSTTTYTPGTSITPLQSNSGIHIQIPTTENIQDKDLSIPNNPIDSSLPSESISEMQSMSVPNQQYDQSKEPQASDSISIEPNQNEEEAPQLFVSDPVFNKEGVTGYTSYTLQGSKIPEPLSRRYRDFDALRKKFLERWPGVFIPNIPHKKTVGNKDKEIIGMRVEMINRFLKKLSKIDYLFNTDEMVLFLQNSNNVPKTLDSIKNDSYEDLLKKYASAFTDYDDKFETCEVTTQQDEFAKKLNENYPRLRAFRTFIFQEKERFKDVQQNYLNVINLLSMYEKKNVTTFVNNDENKLVFFNMKNINLCKNISNAQEKVINPYDRLYQAITEDYLDTEAMIEALESLKGLQDTYNKLTRNLTSTNVQLNDLQAGKTNVKSLLSFKGREEKISGLMMEKEKLEKDIENLGQIIKIATFNMQNQIKAFKNVSLENYYAELSRLEQDTETNATIFDNLWDTVVKDGNISEYN